MCLAAFLVGAWWVFGALRSKPGSSQLQALEQSAVAESEVDPALAAVSAESAALSERRTSVPGVKPAAPVKLFGQVLSTPHATPIPARVTCFGADKQSLSIRADAAGHFSMELPFEVQEIEAEHLSHLQLRVDASWVERSADGGLLLRMQAAPFTPVRIVDAEGMLITGRVLADQSGPGQVLTVGVSALPLQRGARIENSASITRSIRYLCRENIAAEVGIPFPADASGILVELAPTSGYVAATLGRTCVTDSVPYRAGEEILLQLSRDELLAATSTLDFMVVDELSDQPIPGAAFYIMDANKSGIVGIDGVASIRGVPPGVWYLQVHAQGYAKRRQRVDCSTPGRTDLGRVPMEAAHPFCGVVLDDSGSPMAGFSVSLCEWDELLDPLGMAGRMFVRTDDQGRFCYGSGRRVKHAVIVTNGSREWALDVHAVELGSAGSSEVLIQLVRGTRCSIRIANPIDRYLKWQIAKPGSAACLGRGLLGAEHDTLATLAEGEYVLSLLEGADVLGTAKLKVGPVVSDRVEEHEVLVSWN
jgi:hypothetical protein